MSEENSLQRKIELAKNMVTLKILNTIVCAKIFQTYPNSKFPNPNFQYTNNPNKNNPNIETWI